MLSLSQFQKPIIGLSPMDGVSDAPFRFITKKYGNPDLIYTEFTHVQGLCVAGDRLLHHFIYDWSERPVIGQIFGKEPEFFYHAAKIICYLGFDGVDINMGCPAKNVASSGSGAALIKTPDLAREIIAAVREGVKHWVEDGKLTGLSDRTEKALQNKSHSNEKRELIPVSVKTRIGYDHPVTKEWIENLNKAKPDWITVHGRTLKQMYSGNADWNQLKIAVESSFAPVLVNGDIKSKQDIESVLTLTNAKGVLVGRATYGTPWIFKAMRGENISQYETKEFRMKVLLEHTKKFVETYPEEKLFFQMRKHLGWYCSGFDNASEIRMKLMQTKSLSDVEQVVSQYN